MKITCEVCGCDIVEKDVIALNKKLFNKDITTFSCLKCMADNLEVAEDDLRDKIEEFKEEGCTLFK